MNDSDPRQRAWVRENLEAAVALKYFGLLGPHWFAPNCIVDRKQHTVARLALRCCQRLQKPRLKSADLIDAEPIAEVIGNFFVVYFNAGKIFLLLQKGREIVIIIQLAQVGGFFKWLVDVSRNIVQLE